VSAPVDHLVRLVYVNGDPCHRLPAGWRYRIERRPDARRHFAQVEAVSVPAGGPDLIYPIAGPIEDQRAVRLEAV